MKKIFALLLLFSLAGCNYSPVIINTIETKRPAEDFHQPFVTFTEIPSATPIPPSYGFVGLRLKRALERKFYSSGFRNGKGLEIEYSFMEIDLGSHGARSLYPQYDVGEGKLIVNVKFKDSDKKELGEITVNCIIKRGEFDGGIEAVAKEIYTYTRSHYKITRK